MVSDPHLIVNPGVLGAKVSVVSTIVAFAAQTLPVVQWFAALLGGVAAIVSIAWVIKQWMSKK